MPRLHKRRKHPLPYSEREKSRQGGKDICYHDGRYQHHTGRTADMSYRGGNEAEYDKRYHEPEELREYGIERQENTRRPLRHEKSASYTRRNGYNYQHEKIDLDFT